jgi:ubiquinone/menaquinone biosynthesis C-methylase UbiE
MELEAWDSAATLWADHVRGGGDLGWERHAAVLAEMLPPPDGLTVDAGCGEGRFTRDLRARGYDAVGFDATPALIDAARAADPAGIYEIADVRSLPLGDQSAKLVTCINVLQHVADLDATLAEFARVLAVGGVLVAAMVHPVADVGAYDEERDAISVSGYFAEEARPVPLGDFEAIHYHRTIQSYLRALATAGFTLDDLREVPGRTESVPLYLDLSASRAEGKAGLQLE